MNIGVQVPVPAFQAAYERLFGSNARTEELQAERERLRERHRELFADATAHFAACDAVGLEQMLKDRDQIGEQAKALHAQISELQSESGRHSSLQPGLQAKWQKALEKLREHPPISRVVSSLPEIEKYEAELKELQQAVNQAKAAIGSNQMEMQGCENQWKGLLGEYRALEREERLLADRIAQLRLPPEQRRQPSSVFWSDGNGNTFGAQVLPKRA